MVGSPLPAPRFACIRVLSVESVRQGNTTQPFPEIFIVLLSDGLEVPEKGLFDSSGKDRIAVLVALAAPNHDLVPGKVDVFDSEPTTLHHPQPGSVEERRH